jgi:hypothetical protein
MCPHALCFEFGTFDYIFEMRKHLEEVHECTLVDGCWVRNVEVNKEAGK